MDKTFTVKLDKTLYDWIHTYAIQNDLSVSQVVRHALRAHTKFVAPDLAPTKPVESPKPTAQLNETTRQRVLDDWS
jgi:hypothetical protein